MCGSVWVPGEGGLGKAPRWLLPGPLISWAASGVTDDLQRRRLLLLAFSIVFPPCFGIGAINALGGVLVRENITDSNPDFPHLQTDLGIF